MFKNAVPFPTAPGKSEDDLKRIPAFLRANMDQYRESRRRLGTTVERFYLQTTPMGTIMIAYLEGERSFADGTRAMVGSGLEVDRTFIDMVAEITGVDLRQPPSGPPPETVAEWADPQVTTRKTGLGFVAPLLPGKLDAAKGWAREAYEARKAEFTESRRMLLQNVEVVTLTSTPMGDLLCGYLEGDDPVEGNRRFAASPSPYDVWFKDSLQEFFPSEIDFGQPLPPVEQIWDYVALPVHA